MEGMTTIAELANNRSQDPSVVPIAPKVVSAPKRNSRSVDYLRPIPISKKDGSSKPLLTKFERRGNEGGGDVRSSTNTKPPPGPDNDTRAPAFVESRLHRPREVLRSLIGAHPEEGKTNHRKGKTVRGKRGAVPIRLVSDRAVTTTRERFHPRGARQHHAESELAAVSRYVSLIGRGLRHFSDAYLQITAILEVYANQQARVGFRALRLIAVNPVDTLALCLTLIAQIRHEVDVPHELEILDAWREFTMCREFASLMNVEQLEVIRRVPYIQQGELWAEWIALRSDLNERDIAVIVMAFLTHGAMARMGYWLSEVALEVAARFVPPLSLLLSVLNTGRVLSDVLDVWRRRYAVHSEFASIIAGNPSMLEAAASGHRLVPSMLFVDAQVHMETLIDESRSRAHTVLASAGLGLSGLVAGPIVIGASLATAGIIGGLGLAATPFLAATEAYNLARGNELLMTRARRAITAPTVVPPSAPIPSVSTEQESELPPWVDTRGRITEDIDDEEADWLADSLITSNFLPGPSGRWQPPSF